MWFSLTVLLLAAGACVADAKIQRSESLRSKRMVGGTLAPHVPWQVMIYLSDTVLDGGFAGGALISNRWILTAGRNLFVNKSRADTQGQIPIIPKVYVGISRRDEANASTQVAVEKVILHPHFQKDLDWDHDLALIQLKEPVVMSDKVAAIPLPEEGQSGENTGFIAGWGWGAYLTSASSLKFLRLSLASNDVCSKETSQVNFTPYIDNNMICTMGSGTGENVCFGDAGGALAVKDKQTGDVFAAGILSYDKGCQTQRFAVYMRVSSYLPWIHSVLRGDTAGSSALRSGVMAEMYKWQPERLAVDMSG